MVDTDVCGRVYMAVAEVYGWVYMAVAEVYGRVYMAVAEVYGGGGGGDLRMVRVAAAA